MGRYSKGSDADMLFVAVGVVILVVALVIGLLAIGPAMLAWAYNFVIPVLLPGLTASGTIPAHITFWQAFAIIILIGFVSRMFGGGRSDSKA